MINLLLWIDKFVPLPPAFPKFVLSGIIAITNCRGESKFPWKMLLWNLILARIYSPDANYTLQFPMAFVKKLWFCQIFGTFSKTLQEKTEKGTPNDEYENFVNAHLEVAANCIPTQPKTKYRVPWETLAVREKRADVKTASKSFRKNPTNTNALKLKKSQNELASIKEQNT